MVDQGSRLVAVVDDDDAVLESFSFMLGVAGFAVAAYRSAIDFLDDDPARVDCLILDHHMPRMTGLDLAARLRSDGISIPMLLITAAPSPAIVARAAQIGIERVLEKPPTECDLISFVTRGA
jgi:FixJ family two-component response regulator